MENQKTLGEARVRTDFNVSGDKLVDQLKQKTAELINLVDGISATFTDAKANGEVHRVKALATTSYEEAAMWAVKAATF